MMLSIKAWIYQGLAAYTPFTTLCPTFLQAYPNSLETLPVTAYIEANQATSDWTENTPLAERSDIDFHVFVAFNQSTTPICQAIDAFMTAVPRLYTRTLAQDLDDPSVKARHKILKYSRSGITAPILT